MIRKIITNSSWLLFEKLIRILCAVVITAWLARYLGPEKYGILAYAMTVLMFFQALSRFGLDNVLVRELALTNEKDLLYSSLVFRIVISILIFIISNLIMYFTHGYEDYKIYFLCSFSLFFISSEVLELYYQSKSSNKLSVVAKLSSYVFVCGVKLVLLYFKFPLEVFALLISVEAFITSISLFYIFNKTEKELVFNFSYAKVSILIKESWPYLISSLSVIIYMRIDQIMIKSLLGPQELGLYAVVLSLSSQLHFIPITIQKSITPIVSNLKKQNEEKYVIFLSRVFRASVAFGITLSVLTAVLSAYIIEILFGEQFRAASEILSIHIFTFLFICMGVAQTIWMVNEKMASLALKRTLIGLAVCLVLNYLLIPVYGIKGAAISAVISQCSQSVLSNAFLCRKMFIFQLKSLLFIPSRKI